MGAARAFSAARSASKTAFKRRPTWLLRRSQRQARRAQRHKTFDRDRISSGLDTRGRKPDFRQRLARLNPRQAVTAVANKIRSKVQRRTERRRATRNDRDPKTLLPENQKRNKTGWVAGKVAQVGQFAHKRWESTRDMGRRPQYVRGGPALAY